MLVICESFHSLQLAVPIFPPPEAYIAQIIAFDLVLLKLGRVSFSFTVPNFNRLTPF